MQPSRINFYAHGGGGKTTMLVSSMANIYTGELLRPRGIWVQIGQEENPALQELIPAKNIKRFVVDPLNPHAMATDLITFLKALRVEAGKGTSPDILLFDGYTELVIGAPLTEWATMHSWMT